MKEVIKYVYKQKRVKDYVEQTSFQMECRDKYRILKHTTEITKLKDHLK